MIVKKYPLKVCKGCRIKYGKPQHWGIETWNKNRFHSKACFFEYLEKHPEEHYRHTAKARLKISLSKKGKGNWAYGLYGDKNPLWKGNQNWILAKTGLTYKYLHKWVRKYKPKKELCEICLQRKKLELANISKLYKRDINDYLWLCRKCHRKYDKCGERENL